MSGSSVHRGWCAAIACCCLAAVAGVAGPALAGTDGPPRSRVAVTFSGGTLAERATVIAALAASSFPWHIIPQPIAVRIASGLETQSTPGTVSIDANLLDTGSFAWGIVQHEFAHQVDFLVIDSSKREALWRLVGGRAWCWGGTASVLDHAAYGCERLASTIAWAYWPSPANAISPVGSAEVAVADAAAFRRALTRILAASSAPVERAAGVTAAAAAQRDRT